MGGRGALSTTGRRAVGTAASSVFGRGIARTTRSFCSKKCKSRRYGLAILGDNYGW